MHFSQSHDLAIHGLCCLAAQPNGDLVAAKDLADALNAKLTYFAKVLQVLAHAGLVRAERGKLGGYGLSRPAAKITLADVVRALDNSGMAYPCPGNRGCRPSGACAVKSAFGKASHALVEELDKVTLEKLVADLRANGRASRAPWLSAMAT